MICSRFTLKRIVMLAVALRALVLLLFLYKQNWAVETWEYEAIATNILSGSGLTFRSFGSIYHSPVVPAFPMLCAALHWVWGPGFGLYFAAQLVLAAIFILTVYRLAFRVFDEKTALVAALLAAIEPGLIVYQSYKVDVALSATLLMLLSTLGALEAERRNSRRLSFLAGAVGGLSALFRPDTIAVFAGGILLLVISDSRVRTFGRLAVFGLGFGLSISPWLARNYSIHERILITTGAGQLLWAGNNPRSTGTLWTAQGTPMFTSMSPDLRARLDGAGELANHDVFRAAAISHITMDPLAAVTRWVRTFTYFWTLSPDYSQGRYYKSIPNPVFLAGKLIFPVIVLMAVWGSCVAFRKGIRIHLILWAVPLGMSLIHSVQYVEGRHRLLALPFLLILSARGPSVLIWPTSKRTEGN